MNDLELLEYVNNKLKEGMSITKIGEEIGINRKIISRRLKRIGYTFNKVTKQFEKDSNSNKEDSNKEVTEIKPDPEEIRNTVLDVFNSNKDVLEDLTERVLERVLEKEILNIFEYNDIDINNLKSLSKNTKNILDDKNSNKKNNINLDLPNCEDYKTTVTVNNEVWEEFLKKCADLRYYDKKDLLSLALQDFINKY